MVEAQQRKIGLPRLQNEVVVVAHETPGQRAAIEALQTQGQDIEQSPPVHIVHKDRLPPIPARSHWAMAGCIGGSVEMGTVDGEGWQKYCELGHHARQGNKKTSQMATLIPNQGSCDARRRVRAVKTIDCRRKPRAQTVIAGTIRLLLICDDGVPRPKTASCRRDGQGSTHRRLIVRLPTQREEVVLVAAVLVNAHCGGNTGADMAILCRRHSEMGLCAEFLRKRKMPHQLPRNSSSVFEPAHDSIKVMTLHVSKGLEVPVVALVGAGRMPAEGEDEREEARLFYAGATRATQRLVIGASGNGILACI